MAKKTTPPAEKYDTVVNPSVAIATVDVYRQAENQLVENLKNVELAIANYRTQIEKLSQQLSDAEKMKLVANGQLGLIREVNSKVAQAQNQQQAAAPTTPEPGVPA